MVAVTIVARLHRPWAVAWLCGDHTSAAALAMGKVRGCGDHSVAGCLATEIGSGGWHGRARQGDVAGSTAGEARLFLAFLQHA